MTRGHSLNICAEEAGNEDLGERVRTLGFCSGLETCLALLVKDEEALKRIQRVGIVERERRTEIMIPK